MLLKLQTSFHKFKPIVFRPGVNVIVAARGRDSGTEDSRNGVGKSLFFEMIHYCLGAEYAKLNEQRLKHSFFLGWEISLTVRFESIEFTVHRTVSPTEEGTIQIEPLSVELPIRTKVEEDRQRLSCSVDAWRTFLGEHYFSLPADASPKSQPSFRACFNYFARRGKESYLKPLQPVHRQTQAAAFFVLSYLLGLDAESVNRWELNRTEAKSARDYLSAVKKLSSDVEASPRRLEQEIRRRRTELNSLALEQENYRVHKQLKQIESELASLTKDISELSNRITLHETTRIDYVRSLETEAPLSTTEIEGLFTSVQKTLPTRLVRELSEVEQFHKRLIENRKKYLTEEIERLHAIVTDEQLRMEYLSNRRSELVKASEAREMLDQFRRLGKLMSQSTEDLARLEQRRDDLERVEARNRELEEEKTSLAASILESIRRQESTILLVNRILGKVFIELYEKTASLNVLFRDGIKFKPEYSRVGSDGIDLVYLFALDWALVIASKYLGRGIDLLMHDSSVISDVDSRQSSRLLDLAVTLSVEYDTQYVLAFNSDQIPVGSIPGEVFICRELHDDHPEGKLTGEDY